MRVAALLWTLWALAAPAEELSPELQITLTSLRSGERARLEKAVGPLSGLPLYRGDLAFEPSGRAAGVSGKLFLTWTMKAAGQELSLRIPANAAHPGAVTLSRPVVDGLPAHLVLADASLYRLTLPTAAKAGEVVEVELALTAKVPPAPKGSDSMVADPDALRGGGDYGAFSWADDVTSLAGMLPMVAPLNAQGELMAGPSGIGDLGSFDPSAFLFSLTVPRGSVVVAPGNRVGEVPEPQGRVRYSYAVAGARDFPLLVTRGFEVASKKVGEVTVESHFDARDQASGKAVLEHAAAALKELEARLGPYPYTSFRVVEARLAGGAGGMEFPGLITVGMALYRGAVDPFSAVGMPGVQGNPLFKSLLGDLQPLFAHTLEFTVDHEVAHQYWAMLVGNDAVDEPVVDEPLAQHTALLLMEWRRGKKAAEELRDGQLKASYQVHRMMGGADAEADRPASEFSDNSQYAAVMYGKAPLLFDEVRKVVGDGAWALALKTYLEENRYRWARPGTLLAVVERQNKGQARKVEALRQHWWEEQHGDEDLGAMDVGDLMRQFSGKGPKGGGLELDPALMKELEKALKAMGGE